MTEILCRWLNEDVGLSRYIDQGNVAKEFATGYLIGELLDKHALQNDFAEFSQNMTSDSKLNNFTRLEATLKLLEIPYDTNIAHSIMNESHSTTTRLLYQLFITLGKKNKMGLTGVALETMRPSGPVKLENIERGMYKENLQASIHSTQDVILKAVNNQQDIDVFIKNTVMELVKDLQEISVILVSDTKSLIRDVTDLSHDKNLAHRARKIMKSTLQTSKVVMDFVHDVDIIIKSLMTHYDGLPE